MAKKIYKDSFKSRASADGFLAAFDKRHEALQKRMHESSMQYDKNLHEKEMLRMRLEAEKERWKRRSDTKRKKYNKQRSRIGYNRSYQKYDSKRDYDRIAYEPPKKKKLYW